MGIWDQDYEKKHLRWEEFFREEHLNVKGAREKDMPVSATGDKRLPGGTTRREKDREAFAGVKEVRDIGIVAENICVNSVTLTTSASNSSMQKFMHVHNESFPS